MFLSALPSLAFGAQSRAGARCPQALACLALLSLLRSALGTNGRGALLGGGGTSAFEPVSLPLAQVSLTWGKCRGSGLRVPRVDVTSDQ